MSSIEKRNLHDKRAVTAKIKNVLKYSQPEIMRDHTSTLTDLSRMLTKCLNTKPKSAS